MSRRGFLRLLALWSLVVGLVSTGCAKPRKFKSNWTPESPADAAKRAKMKTQRTWSYSGTSGGMRVSGSSKTKSSKSGKKASLSSGAAAGRSTRSAAAARRAAAPARLPWKHRLNAARTKLGAVDAAALPGALGAGDDAQKFAVLERAYKLKVALPAVDLTAVLEGTRDAKVAYAAAYHLSRESSPETRRALSRHVARGAPGASRVQELLGEAGPALVAAAKLQEAKREGWMRDAATGRPGSLSQLRAVEALGAEPGEDISALLRQLAGDQNERVAAAAAEALKKRP